MQSSKLFENQFNNKITLRIIGELSEMCEWKTTSIESRGKLIIRLNGLNSFKNKMNCETIVYFI